MNNIAPRRGLSQSQPESAPSLEGPCFIGGSVGPGGQTVDLFDREGHRHTLDLSDALLAIEAREAARRFGDIEINTVRFLRLGEARDG